MANRLQRREGESPDRFYGRVAHVYRARVRTGDRRPVQSIADEAGVPRSTASQWVFQACKRGLIGETVPGSTTGGADARIAKALTCVATSIGLPSGATQNLIRVAVEMNRRGEIRL